MLGSQENGFFGGAFDFHAGGFDAGVVFEGIVNDAAVKGAHGFQFDDVTPAADFLGGNLGFLDKGVAGFGAVAADVDQDLGVVLVLLEKDSVDEVLEVGEGLALAAQTSSTQPRTARPPPPRLRKAWRRTTSRCPGTPSRKSGPRGRRSGP